MSDVSRRHHLVVRITHWVNAIALTIMIGSGLRIFNAYPAFARKGDTFCCYPFEGHRIPEWLTFGGWLAGARNWHFAMMWVLVANGLVYLGFIYLHGEWRDLVPRRGIVHGAWQMTKFYLALRRDHPAQGKHNALQRLAYFSMPILGDRPVLSGLAIWKPVQLGAADGAAGRVRVGALLAFPGDDVARRRHHRPRVHGVRGRSVRAARDRHGPLQRVEVTAARGTRARS